MGPDPGSKTRRTAETITEHEVEGEKAIPVGLERVLKAENERVVNLPSTNRLVGTAAFVLLV